MKTCRGKNGPHEYAEELKECPECKEARKTRNNSAKRERRAAPGLNLVSGLNLCRKGLHQYPKGLEECPECMKARRPKNNATARAKRAALTPKPSPGFKWCKRKLHQYAETSKTCPECAKIAEAKRVVKATGTIKTCRGKNGPHQYPGEEKVCPECDRLAKRAWEAKPPLGIIKTCKEGHQYPDSEKHCPECLRLWNESPARQESWLRYSRSEKGKAALKAYRESPEGQALQKASQARYLQDPEKKERKLAQTRKWHASPKGKASHKVWRESPEGKAWRSAYRNSPKGRAIDAVVNGRRTLLAAQGDLTEEQWLERQQEFGGCCAYCLIQLLTKADGVKKEHPQYLNLEHIIALDNAGTHTISNVVPACRKCNGSKSNKEVWSWIAETGREVSDLLLPILLIATKSDLGATGLIVIAPAA